MIPLHQPVNVLLADDEMDHLDLLAGALRAAAPQATVRTEATPAGFLNAVANERFDCVIVDFNFRPRRADELLREAAEHIRDTPVIVISGSEEQRVVIDSLRCGVSDFIPKLDALNEPALWHRVEHAIDGARRRSEDRRLQQRREAELTRLAETDHLTGLHNRRMFERALASGRLRHDRRRNSTVLLVDIDHFKAINDRYGHAAGDEVLKAVARIIKDHSDPADTPIRWGGEEFLILKASCDPASGLLAAEHLRAAVAARPIRVRVGDWVAPIVVTVSVGVACFPTAEICEQTIEQADHALYMAKDRGRNRVCTDRMVAAERACDSAAASSPILENAIEAFVKAVESLLGPVQRFYMGQHSQRVAVIARRLGQALGVSEQHLQTLTHLGLLHDLGKIVVPESILAKPGALRPDEWTLVRLAAEEAVLIAQRLGVPTELADCLSASARPFTDLTHAAESPFTLGSPMPLDARVLSVADALASMTADRPHRSAVPMEEAIIELKRRRGVQFAPEVVDAAVRLATRDLQCVAA